MAKSYKQTIINYLQGQIKEQDLGFEHLQYLRQIRAVYAMILEVRERPYILGAIMDQFSISQARAYVIIRETKEIFGQVDVVDKKILRIMAVEMAKEAYRMAKAKEDLKMMNAANKNLILAAGLDKEDQDIPDFEKLQPSLVVAVLPERIEDQINSLLGQGAIDLNQAIEINYEEVGRTDQEGH